MSTAVNDVEALLDSAANEVATKSVSPSNDRDGHSRRDDRHRRDATDDRDRRNGRSDRRRDRVKSPSYEDDNDTPRSRLDRPDSKNSYTSSRHEDRDRDRDRDRRGRDRRDRRDSDDRDGRGDYYRRGGGRYRSRSPDRDRDRYYRPSGGYRERRDDRDRDRERERDRDRRGHRRPERESRRSSPSPEKTPEPTEDERDRRTIFVQQLAARARTKDLAEFFSRAGPVKEAQIVKDRNMTRSKGIGYVEFKDEESVQKAIQLTGQKLLGVPIIAQLAEAEKNREARNNEGSSNAANGVPFHRLYVGNIHFSIDESDLQSVFEPFGKIEFVQLQKEEGGRSKGYGFVQFENANEAKEALDKLNGFDLAGRPIRVGLGNDKFTPESTANLLRNFSSQNQPSFQGSAFSGHGGRGAYAGGSGGTFDRAGGRDTDRGASGASALDDTDVAGVNFNNYSRDALMRKLARIEDEPAKTTNIRAEAKPQIPVAVSQASRGVVLKNMFDPTNESGDNWVKEIEDDVRQECNDKYGKVVHIAVDPNSQGDIYVKFSSVTGGENAMKGLNGRFFNGRTITASPVVDKVYTSLFRNSSKDM